MTVKPEKKSSDALTLRPSRAEDAIALWGESLEYTFRGVTAEQSGVVMGIAGVAFSSPMQAFLSMDDQLKKDKRFLVKGVLAFREIAGGYGGKIFAIPDPKEGTARAFLEHTGFVLDREGIYRWDQQRFSAR